MAYCETLDCRYFTGFVRRGAQKENRRRRMMEMATQHKKRKRKSRSLIWSLVRRSLCVPGGVAPSCVIHCSQ